jgi:hypothetical protein
VARVLLAFARRASVIGLAVVAGCNPDVPGAGPGGRGDAALDAPVDAALDAPLDAPPDAWHDAPLDASIDDPLDAAPDAPIDAPLVDAGPPDADTGACSSTTDCSTGTCCFSNLCVPGQASELPPPFDCIPN